MLEVDDNFDQASSLSVKLFHSACKSLTFLRHGAISFKFHAQGDHHVAPSGKRRKRQSSGNVSGSQTVTGPNTDTFILFDDALSCGADDEGLLSGILNLDTTFDVTTSVNVEGTAMPLKFISFQFSARKRHGPVHSPYLINPTSLSLTIGK